MLAVPAATPETRPEPVPIVAMAVLSLVHVPPEVPSLSVTVPNAQSDVVPEITDGVRLTVTGIEVKQPVDVIV